MFSDNNDPVGFRNNATHQQKLTASNLEALIHPREKLWFGVSLVWSILIYICLLVTLMLFLFAPIFAILGLFTQGLWLGYLRGNSIRVSETQFSEVYAAAQKNCEKLNMPIPAMYIIQSGGVLNAFATRFLMRDYVVLYSEIVEMAYEQGAEALEFVMAHELAHVKRGHLKKRVWILPALLTPFLGKAYRRACEYTCDRFGAHCVPEGAVSGLISLSAGKHLYKQVKVNQFAAQVYHETGFWVWFSEVLSTHPRLPKRLATLLSLESVSRSVATHPAPEAVYGPTKGQPNKHQASAAVNLGSSKEIGRIGQKLV